MSNLLGVVLCGGESKRMGSDKGLLPINHTRWAAFIADKLQDLDIPVVVSVNEKQLEAYEALFPDTPLILDNISINGPLNGLLSVHKNFPAKDILLMACDLVDMDEETLQKLIKVYKEEPQFEFYVYEQDGFTQPFCAIYTSKGLAKVYESFQAKELKKYSLHDRFESENTKYIELEETKAFNNYNTL